MREAKHVMDFQSKDIYKYNIHICKHSVYSQHGIVNNISCKKQVLQGPCSPSLNIVLYV